jgi:hypothetical protein
MKTAPTRTLVLAMAVALAAPAAAAADAFWHEHAATQPQLVLKQGRKWPTDAPLRQGMENIRASLAKAPSYEALAVDVRGEVAGIVQGCKLEPEADAQLHVVLIHLLAAAEAMEGKVDGESRAAGMLRVIGALDAYGSHFDHPGWNLDEIRVDPAS